MFEAFCITQEFVPGHSCYEGNYVKDSIDCFFIIQKSALQIILGRLCCQECPAV